MDNDTEANLPAPAVREEASPAPSRATPRPRRARSSAMFLILIALVVGGLWWWYANERRSAESSRSEAAPVVDPVDLRLSEVERVGQHNRREIETLRARLGDAESVNRSLREELFAFAERSRTLEDAVANLALQRVSGRDTLALNEAEFVLQLAAQRLALFHDPAAAITAYRFADGALAGAEDPLFASVRQTIAAEIHALENAQPLQTQATLAALGELRSALATLPTPAVQVSAADDPALAPSRFARIVGQFVRIRRDDSTLEYASRDIGLTRALVVLDLRAAEAALFARDADAFTAALEQARDGIGRHFDVDATAVRDALARIDRLRATPMAPALPEVGSALRELRNLRTTRALSRETMPAGSVDPDGSEP